MIYLIYLSRSSSSTEDATKKDSNNTNTSSNSNSNQNNNNQKKDSKNNRQDESIISPWVRQRICSWYVRCYFHIMCCSAMVMYHVNRIVGVRMHSITSPGCASFYALLASCPPHFLTCLLLSPYIIFIYIPICIDAFHRAWTCYIHAHLPSCTYYCILTSTYTFLLILILPLPLPCYAMYMGICIFASHGYVSYTYAFPL